MARPRTLPPAGAPPLLTGEHRILNRIQDPWRPLGSIIHQGDGMRESARRAWRPFRGPALLAARDRRRGVLYISYDGVAEPIGQSQIVPYLRRLAALGHPITLISYEKRGDRADSGRMRALADTLAGAGIRWVPLAYHKRPSVPATAFDVAVGFARGAWLIGRRGVTVVHARSYVAALLGWLLKRVTGVKLIFDIRGFWAEERVEAGLWRPAGPLYRVAKRLERRLLRDADAVVTLTERSCDTLRGWIGHDRVPITVIPTCVDLERYAGVRASGVPPTAPVFVYAGSLGTWYALDEMVSFMEEALGRFAAARLILLTRNRADAEAALARSPAVARVAQVVTADPADVPGWLKGADAGLAFCTRGFARQAACPTKAAEYLAMGLPIVVDAGTGDMKAIVEAHRIGAVIPEYSRSAYGEALDRIAELWADPELGPRCRDAAVRRFGLDVGVARYRRLYESLA